MASLTDNIMQQLSSFLHQRLSSVAQEMLVQVEMALVLVLDKERAQSLDLQTPVLAPEADRTLTDGNQPMTQPTHEALYDTKQESVCGSRLDQSPKALSCVVEEAEDPILGLEGFIEPISEDDDDDDNEDNDVNAKTATDELQTDFNSYSDDSNVCSWVRDGAAPLENNTLEFEQPVIIQKTHVPLEKPFSCDICGKDFKRKCNLIVHKRTHTGERPYQCDVCSKSFTQIGALNTHKRRHTGEKPYQCDVCSETFMYTSYLKIHKLTHTEERSHSCEVCGETFTHNGNLKIHKCGPYP